jgi:O-antigen ligase
VGGGGYRRWASAALLLLPGALTVYLSFNAGGFFPNTPAFVALLLAAVLAWRVLFSQNPFGGFTPLLGVAAGALALFGAWTFLSAIWSDAPGRSLIEADRVLLYLLALVLFGSLPRSSQDLRWMIRGLALGFTVVAIVALITRVLPDVWAISPNIANDRLSYPLTYWNALGLLAGLGAILCFHLTSSLGEPRAVRVLAAAALPALGAAALFTYSRGGIAAGLVGLAVYAVVGRPRGMLSGLLAAGPPTAVTVVASLDADLLATAHPTTDAAVAQGHDVAVVVGLCMVGAAFLRSLLLVLDARLPTVHLPGRVRMSVLGATGAAALVLVVALHVPSTVGDQYDRFVDPGPVGKPGDLRTRLTDPANNGRVDQWEVALNGYEAAPMHGEGAGTYELLWAKGRPDDGTVTDAHSLYAEVLGELGLVGLILLGAPLLLILGAAAARTRGPNRTVYAAVFGAGIAWAFHAGIDWDWEMPAVTLWLFAAGGLVLAGPARHSTRLRPAPYPARLGMVGALVALAVVPALVLISQARLDDSLDHFRARNCPAAIDAARDSSSVLGIRAEPYEVIGYCEMRQGSGRRAVTAMQKAIDRDPKDWEHRYGLALARAVAGQDPRRDARAALRMNPRDSQTLDLVERFSNGTPRQWRRRAAVLVRLAFR